MVGPFPGMNPFLEDRDLWPSFHKQLVAALYQILLPGLGDHYRARVGLRAYTSEVPLFTSIVRDHHEEEYLEIRSRGDAKLVTLIDVVSIANKTTAAGRVEYLAMRERAKAERGSLVEIDLLTQGQPLLEYTRENLPEHEYTVTVTRSSAPERYEIYACQLRKRLPKFRLPLAPNDKDAVLDLQIVVARAFDLGQFHQRLDYNKPWPRDLKLSTANQAWITKRIQNSEVLDQDDSD